ncbi:hypothetical protein F5887DRAFT_1235759 [Amanita rubescens]|nr:hypothetical protein F5887DRAFT_1235759 [Amanita rubescens]
MPPTTATHRALQANEIVRLICQEIGTFGTYERRTLFRLCLTCRNFVEPALDVLWYKLDSLYPLLHCLPSDLCSEEVTVVERSRQVKYTLLQSFQRSMLASDWESIEAAAARVHILNYTQKQRDVYQVDSNIFPSLACAAPGRTGLLPRLQKLTWTPTNDIYPYIFLFLSPTIKDLTISVATGNIASDRMRFSLLASLTSQCPSMCSLRLDAGNLQDPVPSWRDLFSGSSASAFASLSLWRALGSLSLQNMDIGILIGVLVTLPALTKLELYWCQISDPTSPSSVTTGFPVLQHLGMYHCNMDITLHVFKRMSGTPLVCLDLSVAARPSESRWAELFNYIQEGISHDSLAAVSFAVDHDYPLWIAADRDRITWTFQTISPLLHFRNISEFKHSRFCILDLEDNDVASIARAWPRLKSFIIHSAHAVRSRLTLHALLPLAKHCPKLEILAMAINATRIGTYREKPGRGFCGMRLRELLVFNSPIWDSELPHFAAFISDIFPNVRVSSDGVYSSRYYQVNMMIPAFVEVRRQEANHRSRSES